VESQDAVLGPAAGLIGATCVLPAQALLRQSPSDTRGTPMQSSRTSQRAHASGNS